MSIISDLYFGNIVPCDLFAKTDSEYQQLSNETTKLEDSFLETLNDNEKSLYEQIWEFRGQQEGIIAEDLFSEGFRLGARLMLEILTKPDRQFI
ncbi:MAG: hypothetical protein J6L58_00045 [Clostridia bacterium]|nr:hypothetical protein [Clostridia bacterium]